MWVDNPFSLRNDQHLHVRNFPYHVKYIEKWTDNKNCQKYIALCRRKNTLPVDPECQRERKVFEKLMFFLLHDLFQEMDREFRKWMRWFGKTYKPYKVGSTVEKCQCQ